MRMLQLLKSILRANIVSGLTTIKLEFIYVQTWLHVVTDYMNKTERMPLLLFIRRKYFEGHE